MIIGEAPGAEEDRTGKPWQGKTGRLLQETLKEIGIDLFEDCISVNAVNCLPPNNRTPTKKEIDCCRDIKVLKALAEHSPKKIILLGGVALTSFLGDRWKKKLGGITMWRGFAAPDQDYKAWVCPTFHPSFVSRMDSREVTVTWKRDLQRAFNMANYITEYLNPKIIYLKNLKKLPNPKKAMTAFDYETTGIKPHAIGHRIKCASIAYSSDTVYTFMMPGRKKKLIPFLKFLLNKGIKKIGANTKFEEQWSDVRLKTEVKSWYWDTMLTAHVLDHRKGITGLKFQVYVYLGIVDYDSEVSPYLRPTKEDKKKYGSNAINRLDELLAKPGGEKLLLKYCALDSINEYRIALIQMAEIENRDLPF